MFQWRTRGLCSSAPPASRGAGKLCTAPALWPLALGARDKVTAEFRSAVTGAGGEAVLDSKDCRAVAAPPLVTLAAGFDAAADAT